VSHRIATFVVNNDPVAANKYIEETAAIGTVLRHTSSPPNAGAKTDDVASRQAEPAAAPALVSGPVLDKLSLLGSSAAGASCFAIAGQYGQNS
jgi:hypothetical protein